MQREERPRPQHLALFNQAKYRWDWRKENPVEVVIVVFAISIFFLMPRQGCGITQLSAGDSNQAAQAAPAQDAAAP
jgi:hypothetical protein